MDIDTKAPEENKVTMQAESKVQIFCLSILFLSKISNFH